MKNIAFSGFRHGHIIALYDQVKVCPDVCIKGAWEEDDAAREEAEREFGVEFSGATFEDLLADDSIDIIAIGDYYGRRGSLAIRALKAGKHVIADKPICTSLEELDEIEHLSKEKNLKVGCLLSLRYSRYTAPAKEIISSGRLGDITAVSFNGQHPLCYGERPMWYFEKGKHGGVINDLAIHGVDLVEYLTGKRLDKIDLSRTWNAYAEKEPDFLDCAQFTVRMEGGCSVQADVSYAVPSHAEFELPFYWQFIIWGKRGVLRFAENGRGLDAYFDNTKAPIYIEGSIPENNHITDFIKEIDGSGTPLVSTEEVIASQRDTLLIQKAAKERKDD